jgi:hypothetical protein
MPANIEIKAVLRNRAAALACAARLASSGPEIIHQEDTFFRCEGAHGSNCASSIPTMEHRATAN